MPSFDVTSEVDLQEVRNAVDQTSREVATRFDFKNTGAALELKDHEITLHAPTEDRLKALTQVLEEKLVRRQVSLKAVHYNRIEEASRGAVRQSVTLNAGISSEHAKTIHKLVRDLTLKGISSQTQGDQVRVVGKKRDDLQAVIAALKAADLDIPLQYGNFRE
ncbi:MAG: YajQ family cyclic di-GMP-binding protein [Acidimicrobiales bacterium]